MIESELEELSKHVGLRLNREISHNRLSLALKKRLEQMSSEERKNISPQLWGSLMEMSGHFKKLNPHDPIRHNSAEAFGLTYIPDEGAWCIELQKDNPEEFVRSVQSSRKFLKWQDQYGAEIRVEGNNVVLKSPILESASEKFVKLVIGSF